VSAVQFFPGHRRCFRDSRAKALDPREMRDRIRLPTRRWREFEPTPGLHLDALPPPHLTLLLLEVAYVSLAAVCFSTAGPYNFIRWHDRRLACVLCRESIQVQSKNEAEHQETIVVYGLCSGKSNASANMIRIEFPD
jgi:hypothetical protein